MNLYNYVNWLPVRYLYDMRIGTVILLLTLTAVLTGVPFFWSLRNHQMQKKRRTAEGLPAKRSKEELDRLYAAPDARMKRVLCLIAGALCLVSVISLPAMLELKAEAVRNGCQKRALQEYSVWELSRNTYLSRQEDILPEQLSGNLYIYYEFGNEYYNDIAQDLKTYTSGIPNVYWIEVHSQQGKQMLDRYYHNQIPVAFYVPYENPDNCVFRLLCGTAPDGSAILDTDNLNFLLDLQARRK